MRRCGTVASPITRVRRIEAFLLLGFTRALEERLIDVAAGFDIAFEFAKPHRSLAELDALALLRIERLGQRGLEVARAGEVVLRRQREAIDFFANGAAQVIDLLFHLAQRRMQRPQLARHLRIALARLGILRAQIGDGRRLQAPREWRRHRPMRFPAGFDLVVFGLGIERQRPRRGEPLVAGRKLLVVDRRILGADEIILRFVDRRACSRRSAAAPAIPSAVPTDRSVARRAAVDCEFFDSAR